MFSCSLDLPSIKSEDFAQYMKKEITDVLQKVNFCLIIVDNHLDLLGTLNTPINAPRCLFDFGDSRGALEREVLSEGGAYSQIQVTSLRY